jgi:hypothetical protein
VNLLNLVRHGIPRYLNEHSVSLELAVVVLKLPKKRATAHQCWSEAFNDFRISLGYWNLHDGDLLRHLGLQGMCNQVFYKAAKTVSHVAQEITDANGKVIGRQHKIGTRPSAEYSFDELHIAFSTYLDAVADTALGVATPLVQ